MRIAPIALTVLLLLALPGGGGERPTVLLVWHALVVLLVLLALREPRPHDAGRLEPAPLYGFAVYLAVVLAGAAVAPYAYAALVQTLELAAFLAVAWLAARSGPGLAARLATPLLAAAAFEGGLALLQRVLEGDPRPAGTFVNPNHLGAWLGAVLLLAAGAALAEREARSPLRFALALPAAAGLLATGSRGALLGVLAGAVWLVLSAWRRLPRKGRRRAASALIVLVVAAGLRVGGRLLEADPYRYHRLRIWRASLGAVLDAPWTGTGPRQFEAAARNLNSPDGREPLRYDRHFSTTHSDLLRPFCELGVPGGLAALLALGLTASALVRRRRAGPLDAGHDGALAALLGLATQGLFDNLSERPALVLLAAVLLGSLLSRETEPRTVGDGDDLRAAPALARLGLGAALLAVFAAADVAPYLAWRSAAALPESRLDEDGAARLGRAIRLNPIHPGYRLRRARELTLDASGWDREAYATAREEAERAVRLHPADSRYRMGLAWVESVACRTLFPDTATRARAAQRYREAEALSRHDPAIPIELAKLLLDTGDPAGARRAAERALAIEPDAVLPRLLLADALLRLGGDDAPGRAEGLVAEAREIALRWNGRLGESRYERQMLTLDEAAAARLERQIAAAREPGGAGEG